MGEQNTAIHLKRTINCAGRLVDLSTPRVMGILNVTPDSFYDGGNLKSDSDLLKQAEKHLQDGATFLDIGAVSTKPNANDVSVEEEEQRLIPALKSISKTFPEAFISVDTSRPSIARMAVDEGAAMINDISGGTFDDKMLETVAALRVPYVMMHIQGMPQNMQDQPSYSDVTKEVLHFFIEQTRKFFDLGGLDLIIDPGFGFGKTVEHNYQLLRELDQFRVLSMPILVGVSRKSMINKVLQTTPADALNGTSVLNTIALQKGASILRVHDVKEASECVKLLGQLNNQSQTKS